MHAVEMLAAACLTRPKGSPCVTGERHLLQKRGLSLNPILTLYYIAPASFCFLSILWIFLEKDAVLAHPMVSTLSP